MGSTLRMQPFFHNSVLKTVGYTVATEYLVTDEEGENMTFAITAGNSLGYFSVDNAAVLHVARSLDYESQKELNLGRQTFKLYSKLNINWKILRTI